MADSCGDKYGSRQLTELENLRAERDAYKQQAEFSAGEIKRLQLNAGIFEDVKAARDNAERDANALRAQLSMRSARVLPSLALAYQQAIRESVGSILSQYAADLILKRAEKIEEANNG